MREDKYKMLQTLPLKHSLAHTGNTYVDELGFFYKNIVTAHGVATPEFEIYQLLKDYDFFPNVELAVLQGKNLLKMKYLTVIGFDDIKKDDTPMYKTAQLVIEEHLGDLIQAINVISQLGIVYNDLLQVGYDDVKKGLVILDFSNSYLDANPETALSRNLESLTSFLSYYNLDFYAKVVARGHTLLNTLKKWDYDMLKLRNYDQGITLSWKIVEAMNVSQQVEEIIQFYGSGHNLENAYFSLNSRHIQLNERLPQTIINVNGKDIRLAFSESHLSLDDQYDWELFPLSSYNNLSVLRNHSNDMDYYNLER